MSEDNFSGPAQFAQPDDEPLPSMIPYTPQSTSKLKTPKRSSTSKAALAGEDASSSPIRATVSPYDVPDSSWNKGQVRRRKTLEEILPDEEPYKRVEDDFLQKEANDDYSSTQHLYFTPKAREANDLGTKVTPQSRVRIMQSESVNPKEANDDYTSIQRPYFTPKARTGDNFGTQVTPPSRARMIKRDTQSESVDPNSNELFDEFLKPVYLILQFTWYLIKNFLFSLRKPLTWIFTIYVAAVLTVYTGQQATKILVKGLQALCSLPGVSESRLIPGCEFHESGLSGDGEKSDSGDWRPYSPWSFVAGPAGPTPNFTKLMDLQRGYSDVLEHCEMCAEAGIHLKAAQTYIFDLSTIIRSSKLNARYVLVRNLNDFAEKVEKTATALTRFHKEVLVEIEAVLIVNEFILRSLEKAERRDAQIEASKLIPGIVGLILTPFRNAESRSVQTDVSLSFIYAWKRIELGLNKLSKEAQEIFDMLEQLDGITILINKAAVAADDRLANDPEVILESLWAKVSDMNYERHEIHRKKFESVTKYRGIARNQVTKTYAELQHMLSNMKELKKTFWEWTKEKIDDINVEETLQSGELKASDVISKKDSQGESGHKQPQTGEPKGNDVSPEEKPQKQKVHFTVEDIPLEAHIETIHHMAQKLMEQRDRGQERAYEDYLRAQEQTEADARGEIVVDYRERIASPGKNWEYDMSETPKEAKKRDKKEKKWFAVYTVVGENKFPPRETEAVERGRKRSSAWF